MTGSRAGRNRCRRVAVLLSTWLLGACGSGLVAERSTAGNQSSGGSSGAMATAGSEAVDTDWTATVRPLGDAGPAEGRPLASDESAPAGMASGQRLSQSSTGSSAANPAVISLINQANAQSRAGDHARAAATLERAIDIEPNNPWLWHRLATSRINEGRLDQAAGLAAKSNALAGGDRQLQADNWKLIAEARRRQGDSGAAAAADAEARKYSN